MGNFAENLNLGNRFRPPLTSTTHKILPPIYTLPTCTYIQEYPTYLNYAWLSN